MLRIYSRCGIIAQKELTLACRKLLQQKPTVFNCSKTWERTISATVPRLSDVLKQKEEEWRKIYYGSLSPQMRGVKLFSILSSIAGLVAQPIIYQEAVKIGNTPLLVAMCSVVGFFTFVTPLLLHLISKKYVTQIEYNQDTDTYKSTTISFVLTPKVLEFKESDIVVPEVPGMFTTFVIKGKPLFIELTHFSEPEHYARFMGFNRPMDFKLGTVPAEADQKPK